MSITNHLQKIYLQPPSRSWTRRCGHMRSCHPRWSGHRRGRTIVVPLWGKRRKSISWDRHVAITRHRRHRSPRWWGHTLWWHWLSRIRWSTSIPAFRPTKMPFVDLSLLLSPQIPPLFQDADISPVWVRQELDLVGPLQVSFSPQFLPNSSQPW